MKRTTFKNTFHPEMRLWVKAGSFKPAEDPHNCDKYKGILHLGEMEEILWDETCLFYCRDRNPEAPNGTYTDWAEAYDGEDLDLP